MAFLYRRAETLEANRFGMIMAVGCGSVLCNLTLAFSQGLDLTQAHISQYIIGGAAGALSIVSMPVFMAAVSRGDLSITWLALTLSFALASGLALIFPGEHVKPLGLLGLLLAVATMVMLGLDVARRMKTGTGGFKKGWFFFMSIAFVLNGLTVYAFTPATYFAPDKSLVHGLGFLIAFAGVIVLGSLPLVVLKKGGGALRPGLICGFLTGLASFSGGYCTLLALQQAGIPGYIVYPATNGGSNVLVVALSVLFLGERPGGFGWSGMAAGTVALMLLGAAT
jgi:uncharacterized membrane protein